MALAVPVHGLAARTWFNSPMPVAASLRLDSDGLVEKDAVPHRLRSIVMSSVSGSHTTSQLSSGRGNELAFG